MIVDRRQAAADPQTKPNNLGCKSACRLPDSTPTIAIYYNYSARKLILILPSRGGQKAESTWVSGYIPRWFTRPQTVTHLDTNPVWRSATTLIIIIIILFFAQIEANALPLRQTIVVQAACQAVVSGTMRCSGTMRLQTACKLLGYRTRLTWHQSSIYRTLTNTAFDLLGVGSTGTAWLWTKILQVTQGRSFTVIRNYADE